MILEQTVRQVLAEKGSAEVFSVAPGVMVSEALALMARKNIGALVVLERDKIVGMFSERDYARRVTLEGRSSSSTAVREVMTTQVVYADPNDRIGAVLALMTNKRIRHVPVLDRGLLVGLVSVGDVVKAVIADQDFVIDQLVRYVTGSDYGWHESDWKRTQRAEERVLD